MSWHTEKDPAVNTNMLDTCPICGRRTEEHFDSWGELTEVPLLAYFTRHRLQALAKVLYPNDDICFAERRTFGPHIAPGWAINTQIRLFCAPCFARNVVLACCACKFITDNILSVPDAFYTEAVPEALAAFDEGGHEHDHALIAAYHAWEALQGVETKEME